MSLSDNTKNIYKAKKRWTLDIIRSGMEQFVKDHGRYPTATEVDAYPHLPSARTIERSYGGMVTLRQQLGLSEEHDFRTGTYSSNRAYQINKRAHTTENQVYEYLIDVFGKEFVHREFFFTDDKRTRADFFIYDKTNGFCVDVFYPNSIRNLSGCLNIKQKKYSKEYVDLQGYPTIFLQMNRDIKQEDIDGLIKNKKRPLIKGQQTMTWDTFKEFCKTRQSRKNLRELSSIPRLY